MPDSRPVQGAVFESGNALALPYPNHSFDAAVMALVLFFVPDTTKAIAEMKRVVRPGGLIHLMSGTCSAAVCQ